MFLFLFFEFLKINQKHPNFNYTSTGFLYGFDILLFILDQPVTFNSYIQPACLPFNESTTDFPQLDSNGLIAGWGLTNGTNDFSFPDALQNVLTIVVDCGVDPATIKNSLICTSNESLDF